MQSSLFIAELMGPVYIVVGVALLTKVEMFKGILQDFLRSSSLMYLAGFLGLLVGIALVLVHNLWVPDWRLIITLVGWGSIGRALATIFQPQWIVAAGAKLLERRAYFLAAGAMNLIIGLALSYFGYLA